MKFNVTDAEVMPPAWALIVTEYRPGRSLSEASVGEPNVPVRAGRDVVGKLAFAS